MVSARSAINKTLEPQTRQLTLVDYIILGVLFACIEMVFINSNFSLFLGPVILVLLLYTYFIMGQTILATTIIVMGNDALGTIFFGSLSFAYVLVVFVFFEMLIRPKITPRSFAFASLALLLCGQLFWMGDTTFRQFFVSCLYTISLIAQCVKYRNRLDEFFDTFGASLGIMLSLISIHALLTGGVQYYEQSIYSEEFMRYGILGPGNGDSNFSCLYLITGIIGTLRCHRFPWYVKVVLVGLMIGAITITLSITGLVVLVLAILFHFAVNSRGYKIAISLILCSTILVVAFNMYQNMPIDKRNATVDAYISRVEEKIQLIEEDDLNTATSNRSGIFKRYVRYICEEQPLVKFLFGGNGVMITGGVPHNTYVDWALQFGLVGLLLLMALIIRRLIGVRTIPCDEYHQKTILMQKFLYLLFAFSLSIYDGSTFGLMFFFVFFL